MGVGCMFRKIKIMIENFLINEWNLYGLQFLSLFVILMMIKNVMDFKQVIVMMVMILIIMFTQRMLGIRFGMLYYEIHKDKINRIMDGLKKMNKKKDK